MQQLENKTALITGASQGIGEATARYFAKHGTKVILVARNADKLNRIVQDIYKDGGEALTVCGDVADYFTLEAAVNAARERFNTLDILVNNAGIIDPVARIAESNVDAWSKVVDVNLKGVYHGLKAAIPAMLDNPKGGTVVNISSGAATGALEGWSHYCSTKAAVLSLTRCAHKEYADQGIRVIGLSPGTVATDMQVVIRDSGINPVSKLEWSQHIPSEWVAKTIGYLTTDEASDLAGDDFSIKNDEGRKRVGLPLLSETT
jgi:NADP-dependent 3-hydroxy acid dehydrogenase YdfG